MLLLRRLDHHGSILAAMLGCYGCSNGFRFMISCDVCEEWFHGSCVGVTRKMGKEIARKKEKWACTKCAKGNYGQRKHCQRLTQC